jgi:hypothetical protein
MKKVRPLNFMLTIALIAPMLAAQAPTAPQADHVLVMLTIKSGVTREQVIPVMPDEVKATVRLYLDGKIENWYARADGKGVVFILNCKTAEEAQSLMDGLPLAKAQFAEFQLTPIGPLTPLRALLGSAPPNPSTKP